MSEFKNVTIGILAHVDAGKTTITEQLLHKSGATKNLGSVDKGSAITDGLLMEKNRGISIKTSAVNFTFNNINFQLVDTPGHIDFTAEVDRSLSILDAVILVISAKEGVQAHTLNIWESIKERKLPVLVFFNKIDRDGVDIESVFKEFQKDLNTKLFAINIPEISNQEEIKLIDFKGANQLNDTTIFDHSLENLAEVDDIFFEEYLEGNTSDLNNILLKAKHKISNKQITPALFGSAKLELGIDKLLESLVFLSESKNTNPTSSYAKVFKVEFDDKKGRLAYIRIFNSKLKNKAFIKCQRLHKDIKINQIFKPHLGNLLQINELNEGEIGIISTSDIILAGDILGDEIINDSYTTISKPILGVEVIAKQEKDYQKLGEALEILNIEDPVLDFKWFKEEKEFHIKILGPIQTEVLQENLLLRWNIEADFKQPKVIYKETPSKTAQGYVRYWMPKPCWAIMTFLIEPAPLGSGITFNSEVRTSDISNKYLNEVKRAIPLSLKQGIYGYEVTDLNITLIEGSEHQVHSNPGDFLLATPMGIMRGLENAGTDLLEPMYYFEIKANQDLLGPVSSDINQMFGTIESTEFENDSFILKGKVSVAEAIDYGIKFNATTSGKGRLKLSLNGYQKTTLSDDKIRGFKGVSPLDESQWILHMRGAYKADER